jgi:hypothetical protein
MFRQFQQKISRKFYAVGASFAALIHKRQLKLWRSACTVNCMKLDFMVCLGILLAILFVGIVGAFFLYVPALTVLTSATMLVGLGLMFALGILTGRRSRKVSPFSERTMQARTDNLYIVR